MHFNLLISLHALRNRCALGILDTKRWQWIYLQVVKTASQVKLNQIRGISTIGRNLFAVTPGSVQFYEIRTNNWGRRKPIFELRHETVLPEWVLGDTEQANMIAIHASKRSECIYVSNNSLGSIDILDFSGELLDRRHLWKIAPSIFKPPKIKGATFKYPVVRFINEDNEGKIYLTIACNRNGESGGVISLDNGKVVVDHFESPHGGTLSENRLYVLEVKKGTLNVLMLNSNVKADQKAEMILAPQFPFPDETDPTQNIRGLALANDRIYCGVFNLKRSIQKRLPARIVCFELENGKQIKTVFVPDSVQFPSPRIFGISPVSEALTPHIDSNSPIFFIHKKQCKPRQRKDSLVTCWGGDELRDIVHDSDAVMTADRRQSSLTMKTSHHDLTTNGQTVHFADSEPLKKIVVSFEEASLCYRRNARFGIGKNRRLRRAMHFWALRNLSFQLYEGETIGIIGRNGSGKSTMAQLCGKVLSPDTGKVEINGSVQLLSLGLGFKKDMTGRDNVYISGALLGLSREQISNRMQDIEDFAEIGDFIDEPMSTYSSGMRSRLGFAVATAVEPDILILDEVMATGDKAFRDKAIKRMQNMRENAKTVIVISHNPGQLKRLCSRILWLEKGRLVFDGPPRRTLSAYQNFCQNPERWLARNPQVVAILEETRQSF